MNTQQWHQSSAFLLATALCELFPRAQVVSFQGTESCFFCDCVFPFSFKKEFLSLVEERMRLILKEKKEVSSCEMMAANAAELMDHQNQHLLTQKLRELGKSTLFVQRMDSFALPLFDVQDAEFEVLAFKLLDVQSLYGNERSVVRIVGFSAEDKRALKVRVKQESCPKGYEQLGVEQGFFYPLEQQKGQCLWTAKAQKVRGALISWWQDLAEQRNFCFVGLPKAICDETDALAALEEYARGSSFKRVAALTSFEGLADRLLCASSVQNFLEESISSLQFILQISKILCFEFELVVSISVEAPKKICSESLAIWKKALAQEKQQGRIERGHCFPYLMKMQLHIQDGWGKSWPGPFVGLLPFEAKSQERTLVVSLLGSLEQTFALLLERGGGQLPSWLQSE